MTELSQEPQWVGIDVSKRTLDVYVRPLGLRIQVANSESGLAELIQTLAAFRVTTRLIVMEATGGYQALAARTLMADGWPLKG
jgi:transposase